MSFSAKSRLRPLFAGTFPKDPEYPDANEDYYHADEARQVYVLSDGASESYNSQLWARILVERWCKAPPGRRVGRWLREAIALYEAQSDQGSMTWSQEAAFARGSFASLLVVELRDEGSVWVVAIGDSLGVLVNRSTLAVSFPYDNADQFRSRPHLLSTIARRNCSPFLIQGMRLFRRGHTSGPCHKVVTPEPGDVILCMTDALGEWLLASCPEQSHRVERLLGLRSEQSFIQLVNGERNAGSMRTDDCTLLILAVEEDVTDS